jgi:hypothetical protein
MRNSDSPPATLGYVTLAALLSRHVTDDVTDVLEKNLGKTVFVTLSRLKRGVPLPPLASWNAVEVPIPNRESSFSPVGSHFWHFLAVPKAS